MAEVLGRDSDAGLREFILPDGGKAIEISCCPIVWREVPVPGKDDVGRITLSVESGEVLREEFPLEVALKFTHASIFKITDALGYKHAYAGFFGEK